MLCNKRSFFWLTLTCFTSTMACTSTPKPEVDELASDGNFVEEVDNEASNTQGIQNSQEGTQNLQEGNNLTDEGMNDENMDWEEEENDEFADENFDENQPASVAPSSLSAVPVTPSTASAPESPQDRVVRYVVKDNTPIYEATDTKSKQVGAYQAGDVIMVKMKGDWAEVNEKYYVQGSSLSVKLIPRQRTGEWKEGSKEGSGTRF